MLDQNGRIDLPFLTAGLEGIGGIIKSRPDDFIVEEQPAYEPSGEGTHLYAFIEKRGITTITAIARIAKELKIKRRDVGFAGLKDTHAITRQWISVEHIEPDALLRLQIPRVKILQLARHRNKILLGHLSTNRFTIRIRNVALPLHEAVKKTEEILDVLTKRGVPNFFGHQRFGNRYDGHLLGKAIITGQIEEFIDIFLGRPMPFEPAVFITARTYYDQGDYQKAVESWPRPFAEHRRALKRLIHTGADKRKAFISVDGHIKRLFVSAYQSDIFNRVLTVRMPLIDTLLQGDMAMKHENGACFRVEDLQAEQPRCDCFEISPTGPILGKRMTELIGPAGEIENPIIQEARESLINAPDLDKHLARGGRRPMRFQPQNAIVSAGQDERGDYIELKFNLDSGCYATIMLREITKSPDE